MYSESAPNRIKQANSFKRFAARSECFGRIHNALPMYSERVVNTTNTYTYSIHRILTICNKYSFHTQNTYSIQQVLTLCNEYFLCTTSIYSMHKVLTLCSKYIPYAASTCSIQRVLTICIEYVLYTLST